MEDIVEEVFDFDNNDKIYNNEELFSVTIYLNKTCYFKGEVLEGKITIKTKETIKKSFLFCPISANATLKEVHNYRFNEGGYDTTEEVILFKYPMNIPKFDNNNIFDGITVPFQFQIPQNCYPSCIFGIESYVRHILTFDLSTIDTKKSTVIIIKNNQYFTEFNMLYKAPSEVTLETYKHKYGIFHMGNFTCTFKLMKNAFYYNEDIPFIIDIDCTNLKIRITKVHINLNLSVKKNNKLNHKETLSLIEKRIASKNLTLLREKKKYHIEDIIKLSKGNPNEIYKKLNNDKRTYKEKYKDILLFPSCYNGLITCEYYFKIILETNTVFSTDEYILMPIDFYEKENDTNDKNDKNDEFNPYQQGFFSTPMGSKKNTVLNRSNTERILLDNNNLAKNAIPKMPNNNIINLNKKDSYSIFDDNEKNEIITAEGKAEENEGYDAPPSIQDNMLNNNK